MSYTTNSGPFLGSFSVTITGGTATSGGGQAAIQNPEGVPLIISDAKLYVATSSTGAANLTIGTAASGTVAATSMLGATAMAAAAGSVFSLAPGGTAVGQNQSATNLWGSADYINVAASASAVGFSGVLYVDYLRTS